MMIGFILLVGFLISLAGMVLIAKPELIWEFLRKNANQLWLRIFAVVVRLLLGISLILECDESRWPFLIMIFGYVAIIAAFFLAVLTNRTFERFMLWILAVVSPFARIGGVFAFGFGLLLIFAFL